MKSFVFFGFLYVSVLLSFCSPNKSSVELGNIEDLQKLFEINFSDLSKYDLYLNGKLLHIRDSLFVGDDDTEWEGKCFYNDQQLVFITENNWMQKDSVSVIQILSPNLKTIKGIGVKSIFSELRSEINFDTWRDFPDGYIMFKDKYNPKLVYEFASTESLNEMALDINTFSDTSIITTILFNR